MSTWQSLGFLATLTLGAAAWFIAAIDDSRTRWDDQTGNGLAAAERGEQGMTLTVGGEFAGYGGAELALASVLDCEPAWFVEFEDAPSRILAHHWPGVPNLHDITTVDWTRVPRVDIITGGSPCQDLSQAGQRKGMTDGTRSNLWVSMRESVAVLRPSLVLWENVRGAFSAAADSALEHCPGCMGDPGQSGPSLRALGRVLGDLSDLGYDSWWYGLRASDVGAAHERFRVFVFAVPADATLDTWRLLHGNRRTPAHVIGAGLEGHQGQAGASPTGRHGHPFEGAGRPDLTLLPTPESKLSDSGPDYARANRTGSGGDDLTTALHRLLPTPRATDGIKGGPNQRGSSGDLMLPSAVTLLPIEALSGGSYNGQTNPTLTDATVRQPQDWGKYAAAIARAEHVTGRPAPAPTEPGTKGQPRLSARFVEWHMGLPAGHVTDPAIWDGWTDTKGRPRTPSAIRNAQLKALGNGIYPAQAAAAFQAFYADLTDRVRQEAAA